LIVLEHAQQRFTGDRDILAALVQMSAQSGDRAAATRWAQKLHDLQVGEAAPGRPEPRDRSEN
jgi:hypothetical protein